MTPNQQRFCDEYIRNGRNATRAYLASYPKCKNENSASTMAGRLLQNVEISAYINEQLESVHSSVIADAAEIMAYLTSVVRGEVTEERVTTRGEVVEARSGTADRNAAAKQLARMLGVDSAIDVARLALDRERATREAERERAATADGIVADVLEAVSGIE